MFLSNEFIKFVNMENQNPLFKVGVISLPRSGATSIIHQLIYNPIFRFSTITESLSKE